MNCSSRKLKRLFDCFGAWLVAAFLVGACVYDYAPLVPEGGGIAVINGDILIGYTTEVKIGRSVAIGSPLSGNLEADAVYVEDNGGGRYPGVKTEDIRYLIDTKDADPSKEYRLVVEMGSSIYESEWQPVLQAADIDSISFSFDEDHKSIYLDVTAHSDQANHYYRWRALQTWEYHAAVNALYFFVPAGSLLDGVPVPVDTVAPYENRVNHYFCWNACEVADLMIASTAQMEENRLVCHRLYAMDYHDQRTQMLYSVNLIQEAITEQAWRYYETVNNNSQDVGGLFSPQPAEIWGNIHERNHPERKAIGFVCVTRPTIKQLMIDFESFLFHKMGDWERLEGIVVGERKNWSFYYAHGYLVTYPFMMDQSIDYNRYEWAFARCVDCRMMGGTKQKPDWWPNDHR